MLSQKSIFKWNLVGLMLVILQMISQKKQKLQQIHKFHIGIFQIPLQQYEKSKI
jgi:hypothetical protein